MEKLHRMEEEMGYKAPKTIYKLVFEGTKYEGLVVNVRSLSTGRLMQLMKTAQVFHGREDDGAEFSPADLEAIDELYQGFAKALVSWNLEDEDEETGADVPVPATLEGIHSQDFGLTLRVILAWVEAVAGVGDDLGKGSSSGRRSVADSLEMVAL